MRKKMLALGLALAMVWQMTACRSAGGEKDKAASGTQIAAETEARTETQSEAVQTATAQGGIEEAAVSGNEVPESEEEAQKDEYFNIAFFGLDVNTNLTKDSAGRWKQLMKGFRSDSIMILSINRTTGDVKVVSVYRDTLLNNGNDNYHKANAAYSVGGPELAVKMLNMNLDMDIDKYIAISYHSMMDLVDGLGGISVDVEKAALNEINGYQNTIVTDLKLPGYTPVTEAGPQVLNGLQVCAYSRLRHDFPRGDLDRAAHQRKVLKAIEDKVKQADPKTLMPIFDTVMGEICTNCDSEELLEIVRDIRSYKIVDEGGFPADDMVAIGTIGKEGSCVLPINLKSNVIWLHQFLFEEEDYEPSPVVEEINATIEAKIAPYIKKK